ncbi:MAG: PA0069 family radical SAM protein [Planctomycetota bacterium]
MRGRGAGTNPKNRFRTIHTERNPDLNAAEAYEPEFDESSPKTELIEDHSRSILSSNDSPDVPFSKSINPYRGCEHGCAYCYARPTHEYFGLSAGLDFETKIVVKYKAAELLREEFTKMRWTGEVLGISGVTDAYQPVERTLQITRKCLAVCAEFQNPVMIVTKSDLIVRDVDILQQLAAAGAVSVAISVTTLDLQLARKLEPRATSPRRRMEAIRALAKANIPVSVLVAPVIPGLNDHEIPEILKTAAEAGARFAGYVLLRLPHGVKDIFTEWLELHTPNSINRVLHRVAETRGGKLSDPRFGTRMRGEGVYAEHIRGLFTLARKRHGYSLDYPALSASTFRRPKPSGGQQLLFPSL